MAPWRGSRRAAGIDTLREHGFDDQTVSDIVQITGLFAYSNRLADGLGIDDEPEWQQAR